jgi:hypothetical protein
VAGCGSSREVKSRAKHVNTCLNDLEARTRGNLKVLKICHLDRGRLYEPISVKNIILCALEVEIINKHVFTLHPGEFTKFCTYNDPVFCSIICNYCMRRPMVTCSIDKFNKFRCSPPHSSYPAFPSSL